MSRYLCQRCRRVNSWHQYSPGNLMFKCQRCGTPHSLPAGEPIGPEPHPITSNAPRITMWFSGQYWPTVPGDYECVFVLSPRSVTLTWHAGRWFWHGARVDTTTLIKWRGRW